MLASPVFAAELRETTAAAIQDNSFLIEEAYNQEKGIVQHILNVRGSFDRVSGRSERAWDFVFTQEWPVFSQDHQFSYTVPYSFLGGGGRPSVDGIGDVLLNYRYQALMETQHRPAFAPRFSLILPTGDEDKGLGSDTVGYQFNLPVSKIVHDRVTLHGNAGLTYFPDVQDRDPVSYHLGASAIYAFNSRFNFMLETLGEWHEDVDAARIQREFRAVVSPGFRYAINANYGQWVFGIAAPIGVSRDAPDYSVFFYVSFEHGLSRKKDAQ